VEHHPTQLTAQFQLGFYYSEADRYDEAIVRFQDVIARSVQRGESRRGDEVRYFLGRALQDQNRDQEALEVLAEIPTESERYADARIVMARIYEEDDDLDHALDEVRRAAAAVPENRALMTYMAGLLQRTGDLPAAVELMQRLIESDPDDAELYYDLGLIYGNAGQTDEAMVEMERVLERDEDHPSALNYVGYSWADRGQRLDEAEAYILRATELRPNDGFITDSVGWVYYQRGLKRLEGGDARGARASFDAAIEKLELALELLEEDDPIITRHLADAYRSVSRFDDALVTYKRALALGPSDDEAADIRRQIELLEAQVQGRVN
jgi:tetratricopeptide (TPR) repeat protein